MGNIQSQHQETQREQVSFTEHFLTDDKWQQINLNGGAIMSSSILQGANMSADALLRRREAFPFVINYYSWHKHSILLLHLKKKKKMG